MARYLTQESGDLLTLEPGDGSLLTEESGLVAYLLQEDGVSQIVLENGSGVVLLEWSDEESTTAGHATGRHFRIERPPDDEDALIATTLLLAS